MLTGILSALHPRRETGGLRDIPYAEPTWLAKPFHTPYYDDTHRALQRAMREMVDKHIYPDAQACEENGKGPSKEVLKIMADSNVHAMVSLLSAWASYRLADHLPFALLLLLLLPLLLRSASQRFGPGKHLAGLELMKGIVTPEKFDYFHELILTQEVALTAARGYGDGLGGGNVIGLPPVINFGSKELYDEVVPGVLQGEKFISLAISEAFAGSDVSDRVSKCSPYDSMSGT